VPKTMIFSVLLAGGVLCYCGCSGKTRNPKGEIKLEVLSSGTKIVSDSILQCGDSFYGPNPSGIIELKGFRYAIREEPLTKADRLNGYDWKAHIDIQYDAERFRSNRTKAWTNWQSVKTFAWAPSFEKRSGVIYGVTTGPDKKRPRDCEDIPK
jgi:hypothetical protein